MIFGSQNAVLSPMRNVGEPSDFQLDAGDSPALPRRAAMPPPRRSASSENAADNLGVAKRYVDYKMAAASSWDENSRKSSAKSVPGT